MADLLLRIKRAVLAGNIVFTVKAQDEMERDGLLRADVTESIVYANAIYKTISSANPHTGKKEHLHIINSTNLSGLPVYSKGKLVAEAGVETYYVLISAKRST